MSQKNPESTDSEEDLSFADMMRREESGLGDKRFHERPGINVVRRRRHQTVAPAPLAGQEKNRRADDPYCHKTLGCQNKKFQRLKQGKLKVTGRCDLHGCTAEQAKRQLLLFLGQQAPRNNECVLVVCGKGLHSSGREPVIKNMAMDFMRSRMEVLAYCPALQKDGGHGAFYVLMRQSRGAGQ